MYRPSWRALPCAGQVGPRVLPCITVALALPYPLCHQATNFCGPSPASDSLSCRIQPSIGNPIEPCSSSPLPSQFAATCIWHIRGARGAYKPEQPPREADASPAPAQGPTGAGSDTHGGHTHAAGVLAAARAHAPRGKYSRLGPEARRAVGAGPVGGGASAGDSGAAGGHGHDSDARRSSSDSTAPRPSPAHSKWLGVGTGSGAGSGQSWHSAANGSSSGRRTGVAACVRPLWIVAERPLFTKAHFARNNHLQCASKIPFLLECPPPSCHAVPHHCPVHTRSSEHSDVCVSHSVPREPSCLHLNAVPCGFECGCVVVSRLQHLCGSAVTIPAAHANLPALRDSQAVVNGCFGAGFTCQQTDHLLQQNSLNPPQSPSRCSAVKLATAHIFHVSFVSHCPNVFVFACVCRHISLTTCIKHVRLRGPSLFVAKSYFLALIFFSIKKKRFRAKKNSALKKRFHAKKKIFLHDHHVCLKKLHGGGLQGVLLHQANPSEAMPVFCSTLFRHLSQSPCSQLHTVGEPGFQD